ncbi:hypothetical protein [Vibrio sp. FJH11]
MNTTKTQHQIGGERGCFQTLLYIRTMTLFMLSATAFANDETTPAEETICNELKYSTPGLYGLCVAYCEAQDGETTVDPENLSDLTPPSRKILEKYNSKMQEGDPAMPCVNYESACPVWTFAQLADVGTHGGNVLERVNQTLDSQVGLYDDREYEAGSGIVYALVYHDVFDNNDDYVGRYFHNYPMDPLENTDIVMFLTEPEYEACKNELLANQLLPD